MGTLSRQASPPRRRRRASRQSLEEELRMGRQVLARREGVMLAVFAIKYTLYGGTGFSHAQRGKLQRAAKQMWLCSATLRPTLFLLCAVCSLGASSCHGAVQLAPALLRERSKFCLSSFSTLRSVRTSKSASFWALQAPTQSIHAWLHSQQRHLRSRDARPCPKCKTCSGP